MNDLLFNVVVPVENFHGFTLKTEKCKAVPAGGDKSLQSQHLCSSKMCHCFKNVQITHSKSVPTLPHGPFHQSNLIR